MSVPCAAEILTVDDNGEAEEVAAADGGSDEGWEGGSGEVVFSAGKMKTPKSRYIKQRNTRWVKEDRGGTVEMRLVGQAPRRNWRTVSDDLV